MYHQERSQGEQTSQPPRTPKRDILLFYCSSIVFSTIDYCFLLFNHGPKAGQSLSKRETWHVWRGLPCPTWNVLSYLSGMTSFLDPLRRCNFPPIWRNPALPNKILVAALMTTLLFQTHTYNITKYHNNTKQVTPLKNKIPTIKWIKAGGWFLLYLAMTIHTFYSHFLVYYFFSFLTRQ